ncbi:MAG TPA: O-antigen ligase family protein [Sphingomonas sp.]|nr:O-antigen ligase family protein [Sphingomonas sp.]
MSRAAPGRFTIIAYLLFLGVVALTGGSSHYDAASQPVVRLAAILLIGALALRRSDRDISSYRPAFWFLTALALIIFLQLVSLPPGLWTDLPGRDRYLAAAIAAGEPQPWRPINLMPDRGWNALFALLPPIAALLAVSRVRTRDQIAVMAAWLLIVVASAVLGLAQVSAGSDDTLRFYAAPPTTSAVGLFANRNHQALLICCGLPMLAVWTDLMRADRATARLHGAIAIVSAAFLLLVIPTTGSRTGLMLLALALPFAIALAWPALKAAVGTLSRPRRTVVVAAALTALAVLIAVALTFSRAESVQRLFAIDPVEDARVRLLRPLMAMIHGFFPFGSGFGSFEPVYLGFEPFGNLAVTIMNQAHDDYLQLALEAGLPGLLLLIAFLGWWGWTSLRLWRRADGEGRLLGRLGSVVLLLIMVASATDYPVRTPLMMVLAAQSAGWMLLPARRRTDHGEMRIKTG